MMRPKSCLLASLVAASLGCSSVPVREPAVNVWYEPAEPDTIDEEVVESSAQPTNVAAIDEAIYDGVEMPVDDTLLTEASTLSADVEFATEDAREPQLASLELVSSALQFYEASTSFWQEGDFDDALLALDRSYELMHRIEAEDDLELVQQKEDLRHMISRRIVEIYGSQRTAAGDYSGSIPLEKTESVERWIKSFQTRERQDFLAAYQRSGLYRPMILAKLRAAGMPEELSWLPMVESWFKVRALSRAQALGMWQFISSTGYRYGLERSHWFDERMDPEKSTDAALAYLSDLHGLFGDWLTALAGYNCGEARVQRVIRSQSEGYLDRFWDIHPKLPRETRAYVPRLIAAILILNDPLAYGFDDLPPRYTPLDVTIVETTRSVRLVDLEKQMQLPQNSLVELNPELRQKATPSAVYSLRVPTEASARVLASLESVPKAPPPAVVASHRVRKGETLSTVAQRYGTSVSSLMQLNNIRNANRIWPGQTLKVQGTASSSYSGSSSSQSPTTYTVRSGDSLWTIARRFGTTVDSIKRSNSLGSTRLKPGQRLTINGGSAQGLYVVRRGDTLGGIARSSRVSLNALVAANNLSTRSNIYPGQKLVIPASAQ